MLKLKIFFFALFYLSLTQYCPSSPASSAAQGIVTGTFVVGGPRGMAALTNGQDITCYNYTLQTPMSGIPSVVTAINGFGVNPSNNIFFSVRPLYSPSPTFIPFQIRAQWKQAYWNSLSVSFLAEIRADFEAGTRIIDAGLSPCSATQSSTISLYYASAGSYTNVYVFLSGFEASSSNSVIDIRISGASQAGAGFSFQVSTQAGNTITTVWVGYIAYSTAASSFQIIGGALQQNGVQGSQSFPLNTQVFGLTFFGLSGISFNSGSPQGFSSSVNAGALSFSFGVGSLNFASQSYVVFGNAGGSTTTGCGTCQGYPYAYGSSCVAQCPSGTYPGNGVCSTTPPISNPCSAIPNSSFNGTYCVCNPGYIQQGNACVQSTGTTNPCSYIPNSYFNGQYCICNQGYIQQGSACIAQITTPPITTPPITTPPITVPPTSTNPCGFIPNSYFDGTACQCSQGYVQSGSVCVPSAATNPCSFIPNSNYNGFSCICNTGYVQSGNSCVSPSTIPTTPPTTTIPIITTPTIIISGGSGSTTGGPPITCPQGTFNLRGRCQNCPKGCSICTSSSVCVTCLNGFNVSQGQCVQRCGKGFRVFLACDDGNTISGDGCSSNCTIESGWTCSGGSPNTPDRCTYLTPAAVVLTSTGQVHTYGSIYANVRINYLPTNLSQNNCSRCNDNILLVNLTTKPLTQPKISSSYIKGSSYTFSVKFQFPGEPISEFSATVQINPALALTYFAGVDVSQVITLNINPAVMALQDNVGQLALP